MSSLSLAPRKVGRKPATKAIPKVTPVVIPDQTMEIEPVASTSALLAKNDQDQSEAEAVPVIATEKAEEEQQPKLDKTALKRQADLLFEVETCLSDWYLSRSPELLERLSAAEDGYIHISNLLQLSNIASYKTTMGEIMLLRSIESQYISFDETGFKIKRQSPLDVEQIGSTDWSTRAYYFENIPLYPPSSATPAVARQYLSSLLNTNIQTVRFPPLYNDTSSSTIPAASTSLLSAGTKDAETKAKEKASKIPEGGGPFKGFCFAVLGDDAAVELATREWNWARVAPVETEEDGDSSSEDEDAKAEAEVGEKTEFSVDQKARRAGLRSMPITEWNTLKAEYLRYQRALTKLQPRQRSPSPERYSRHSHYSSSSYRDKDRDRYSSRTEGRSNDADWRSSRHTSRRSPSPIARSSDWKSARDQTWQRETKDMQEAEASYPKGVVCFVKHVHTKANKSTLKALFNDAIEVCGGMPKDEVVYVEFESGMDCAYVRTSTPGAAVALKMYFQGRGAVMASKDCTSCSKLGTEGQEGLEPDAGPLSVEVFTGEREKIYWSKIPLSARPNVKIGRRQQKRSRQDFTSVAPEAEPTENQQESGKEMMEVDKSEPADLEVETSIAE